MRTARGGSRRVFSSLLRRSAFCALILSSALALADDVSVIRIDYSVPAGCPDQAAFAAQMLARSGRVRVTSTIEEARSVTIRITSERGRLVGHLTVREVDGTESERTVAGETCAQVVAGLAFVTAVALTPSSADAGALDAGSSGDERAAGQSAGAEAGPPERSPTTEAQAPGEADQGKGTTADAAPASPWEISVGVDGRIVSGSGPETLLAIPVFAELASTSRSVLAPSARGRFERASSSRRSAAGGADFTWTSGSADLCPVAWSQGRFRSEPCLRTEVGTLAAAGVGLQPLRSSVRPWLSVGPVARGRVQLFRPLFLELEGSLAVPLFRDHFFVEPNATLFRVPPVEVGLALGAGITIW